LNTERHLNYVQGSGLYLIDTFRIQYKDQPVNFAQGINGYLS